MALSPKVQETTAFSEIKRSHSFIVAVKAAVVKRVKPHGYEFSGNGRSVGRPAFCSGGAAPPPKSKAPATAGQRGNIMEQEIIAAVLALCGSLCGTYFANRKASALIAYRLEQLEQKVNRHNHVIERQYELEKRFAEHERDYAAACHRIRELEKGA